MDIDFCIPVVALSLSPNNTAKWQRNSSRSSNRRGYSNFSRRISCSEFVVGEIAPSHSRRCRGSFLADGNAGVTAGWGGGESSPVLLLLLLQTKTVLCQIRRRHCGITLSVLLLLLLGHCEESGEGKSVSRRTLAKEQLFLHFVGSAVARTRRKILRRHSNERTNKLPVSTGSSSARGRENQGSGNAWIDNSLTYYRGNMLCTGLVTGFDRDKRRKLFISRELMKTLRRPSVRPSVP